MIELNRYFGVKVEKLMKLQKTFLSNQNKSKKHKK